MIGLGIGVNKLRGGDQLAALITSLFGGGEQGSVYDPSDFSTLYQDSAGTTPVTAVEQPIGLMLDKRFGTARGAELVPALDLSAAGWETVGTPTSVVASGFTIASASPGGRRTSILTANRTYAFSIGFTKTDAVTVFGLRLMVGGVLTDYSSTAASGTIQGVATVSGVDAAWFYLRLANNATVTITNISVKQIGTGIGNHALQATAASRPVLSARVNALLNSQLAGGASPATPPTSWAVAFATGTSEPSGLTADGNVILLQTAVAQRPFIVPVAVTQLAVGDVLMMSLHIDELVSGTPTIVDVLARQGTAVTTNAYFKNGIAVLSSDTFATGDRLMLRVTCTTAGSQQIRMGLGSSANVTATVKLSRPQHESGPTATRYQRTGPARNLLTKTDQFDDAYWQNGGTVTIAANAALAPDGNMTADVMTEAATTAFHRLSANTNLSVPGTNNALQNTITCHFKAIAGAPWGMLMMSDTSGTNSVRAWFNLATGAVGSTAFIGSGGSMALSITDLGNSWYRCRLSGVMPGGTGTTFGYVAMADADASLSFLGSTGRSVAIWGAQLEPGSVATPYERVDTAANTYDSVGFPVGLRCDGVDDGMATAAIDFSATSAMTVWAGVRKESDAGVANILELSAGGGLGSFAMQGPGSNSLPTFRHYVVGSLTGNVNPSGFAAPYSAVLSADMDIGADKNILRVNGSATTSATDLGTGNFGNHILYLFRRGGTTLPFNGLFYGAVIRGAASTAAQIAAGERNLAAKSGVSLA